ncbi:MAG TPA: hypothetical protein VGD74_07955 [Vulgatibacter sp.]
MFRLAAVLAFATLLPALPAHARLLDSQREHDGFFLRFQLGGGSMDAKWKDFGFSQSAGGPSGVFGLAMGGAIARNLILFGEVTRESATDPHVRFEDVRYRSRDLKLSQSGFGPGLAYYFMPVNLYLSGTMLFLRGSIEDDAGIDRTELGYGLKVALGKEWWISRDWGIGLAAIATFAGLPVDDAKIETTNLGLAFTATYN